MYLQQNLAIQCQSCGFGPAAAKGVCGHLYCEHCASVIVDFTQQCPVCEAECLRTQMCDAGWLELGEFAENEYRSFMDTVMCTVHMETECTIFCHDCKAFFCPRCARHRALEHAVIDIRGVGSAQQGLTGFELGLKTRDGLVTSLYGGGVVLRGRSGFSVSRQVTPVRLGEAYIAQTEEPLISGLIADDLALLSEVFFAIFHTRDVALGLERRGVETYRTELFRQLLHGARLGLDASQARYLERTLIVNGMEFSTAGYRGPKRGASREDFQSPAVGRQDEPLEPGCLCYVQSSQKVHLVLDKVQRHCLVCPLDDDGLEPGVDMRLCSWEPLSQLQQLTLGSENAAVCTGLFSLIRQCRPRELRYIAEVCRASAVSSAIQCCVGPSMCLASRLCSLSVADAAVAFRAMFYAGSQMKPESSTSLEPVTLENYRHGGFVVRNPASWRYGKQDETPRGFVMNAVVFYPGRLFGFGRNPGVLGVWWLGGSLNVYRPGEVCYCARAEELFHGFGGVLSPSGWSGKKLLETGDGSCWCGGQSTPDPYLLPKAPLGALLSTSATSLFQPRPQCRVFLPPRTPPPAPRQLRKRAKTHYTSPLLGFQESFWPGLASRDVQKVIRRSALAYYAGPPVVASGLRARLPAVVTIGEDWHHGTQWEGPAGQEKIGVMLFSRAYQQGDQVCVRWLGDMGPEIQALRERAGEVWKVTVEILGEGSGKELQRILETPPPHKDTAPCFVYDAGRARIFELAYYDRRVTPTNFVQMELVGPGVDFQGQPQILGVLLWLQDAWAIVYWMSGALGRHRVGAGGKYELTYASGY